MPWSDGLDEAALGHARLNGWQPEGDAEEIARAAVLKHLEAQRIISAPPDEFVRIPKEAADAEGWGNLYARLGVPPDPKAYTFETRFGDGTPVSDDPQTVEWLRATAAKLHLSPADAQILAADLIKLTDDAASAQNLDLLMRVQNETDALKRNWGANYDVFKFAADRAAALLGLNANEVAEIGGRSQLGYAGLMDKLRVIADRMGEAPLLGGRDAAPRAMSREEALAKHEELLHDRAWGTRYLNGDTSARAEMEAINRAIVGPRY